MPQIYEMGPTALLPLRRKACWGFFRPKNPKASAGFVPTNLGTKGQHANPRPPKPYVLRICHKIFVIEPTQREWRSSKLFLQICTMSNQNILRESVRFKKRLQHFSHASATWRMQTRKRLLKKSVRRSAEVSPVPRSSLYYVRGFNRQISPLTQTHKCKSHEVRSDFAPGHSDGPQRPIHRLKAVVMQHTKSKHKTWQCSMTGNSQALC